jgi:hypothetical protein
LQTIITVRPLVHASGGERGKLQERRARIEQALHAVARQEFAAAGVFPARLLGAAAGGDGGAFAQVFHEGGHGGGVAGEGFGGGIRLGLDGAHAP